MAKFCCGITPLQIEIGHYNGADIEHHLCSLCDKNEIEDECHVLIRCDMYDDIRSDLFEMCQHILDLIA